MLNQCYIPPTDPLLKQCTIAPLRRRSLGVLEQLESCHIGARESKDYVVRSGSLPTTSSNTAPVPGVQASSLPDPSYSSVQALPPIPNSSLIHRWNESRPLAQTGPVEFPDWRSLYIDNSVSKKRKLDGELAAAEAHRHIRQSSQISPRTTPISSLPPAKGHSGDLALDTSDMLWTSSTPSLSEIEPSHPSMFTSWPDFDWNAFDKLGAVQYRSQPLHQAIPMDVTIPDKQRTALFHQPRVVQSHPQNVWQQNIARVSSPQAPHPSTFESAQTPRQFQNTHHQVHPHQIVSNGSATPVNVCVSSSQPPASLFKNYNDASRPSPILLSHQRGIQPQRKQTLTSSNLIQVSPPQTRTESSDLLRKPSLYTIPAWPSPPDMGTVQKSIATSPQQSSPSTSSTIRDGVFQSQTNFNTLRQPSKLMQSEKLRSGYSQTSFRAGPLNISNITKPAESEKFQLPRARAGRKHCPNLYVHYTKPSMLTPY
jgi:hypothetical protein